MDGSPTAEHVSRRKKGGEPKGIFVLLTTSALMDTGELFRCAGISLHGGVRGCAPRLSPFFFCVFLRSLRVTG